MDHPAAPIVRDAADLLDGALSEKVPPPPVRAGVDDLSTETLRSALQLLRQAENEFDAERNRGKPAVLDAMSRVRKASDAIDSTRGFVRWMPTELVYARADAQRLLDHVTDRW